MTFIKMVICLWFTLQLLSRNWLLGEAAQCETGKYVIKNSGIVADCPEECYNVIVKNISNKDVFFNNLCVNEIASQGCCNKVEDYYFISESSTTTATVSSIPNWIKDKTNTTGTAVLTSPDYLYNNTKITSTTITKKTNIDNEATTLENTTLAPKPPENGWEREVLEFLQEKWNNFPEEGKVGLLIAVAFILFYIVYKVVVTSKARKERESQYQGEGEPLTAQEERLIAPDAGSDIPLVLIHVPADSADNASNDSGYTGSSPTFLDRISNAFTSNGTPPTSA